MDLKSHHEWYKIFVEFISSHLQKERHLAHRRIFYVFAWCVLIPSILTVVTLFLVKMHFLPRSVRNHLDWLILIMPTLYSLYILSSEVIAQMPIVFRKGGIASSLVLNAQENQWREKTIEAMHQSLFAVHFEEWNCIVYSFKTDLTKMRDRAKYLTALAGVVFFLLLQGIDSLVGYDIHQQRVFKTAWIESSSLSFYEFTGLGLFLFLFYLSSNCSFFKSLSKLCRTHFNAKKE